MILCRVEKLVEFCRDFLRGSITLFLMDQPDNSFDKWMIQRREICPTLRKLEQNCKLIWLGRRSSVLLVGEIQGIIFREKIYRAGVQDEGFIVWEHQIREDSSVVINNKNMNMNFWTASEKALYQRYKVLTSFCSALARSYSEYYV